MSDIRYLTEDRGLRTLMVRAGYPRLGRKERRRIERAVRRGRHWVVPSPSSIFRCLNAFHDEAEMAKREKGTAWIPEASEELTALGLVNRDLVAAVQARSPEGIATLDMDATLVETHKREAVRCYQGFRSYRPLTVWWAEQGLVVGSGLRDGNVPAQTGYLQMVREELEQPLLPEAAQQLGSVFRGGHCGRAVHVGGGGDQPGLARRGGDPLVPAAVRESGGGARDHEAGPGGRLPSGKLGANAAWWQVMILALNLNEVMKPQVLAKVEGGESLAVARLKALRYLLLHVAGRVIGHGRRLVVRIAADHPSLPLRLGMRARILELAAASSAEAFTASDQGHPHHGSVGQALPEPAERATHFTLSSLSRPLTPLVSAWPLPGTTFSSTATPAACLAVVLGRRGRTTGKW